MGAHLFLRATRRGLVIVALLNACLAAPAATNQVLSRILMVRAGGVPVYGELSPNTNRTPFLNLTKPQRLEVSFAPVPAFSNDPIRFRAKLEGFEDRWHEAGGEMDFWLIVLGASNNILSYHSFSMEGESEGWRGEAAMSPFRPRHAQIPLPVGAERLKLLLISEERSVLGSAAITDLRLQHIRADAADEILWTDPRFEQGENLGQPEGTPRHWQRGSLGASMALVMPLTPPDTGHALLIKDDDVLMSASWQVDVPLGKPVQAGDMLELQWREAFSVGIGSRTRYTRDVSMPGNYVFRLRTVSAFGEPLGAELALAINIPPPWWRRPAFVVPVVLISGAAIAATAWIIAHRRLRTRLLVLDHRRKMEQERVRIAQDIHDDLGASLTKISLLSQTAHEKLPGDNPAWQDTERLRTMAVRLTQQLDEIVWAVNPQHDTLESLLSYLTDFAEEFLAAAGIRARIQIPVELPDWPLPSSLRHNVFLAAKEALNNAVKHARASEIRLHSTVTRLGFELTIEDDGIGFSPPPPASGAPPPRRHHGLSGLQYRMESIGGQFQLVTAPGRGTRVTLAVPVKGAAP